MSVCKCVPVCVLGLVCVRVCVRVCYSSCGIYTVHVVQCIDFLNPVFSTLFQIDLDSLEAEGNFRPFIAEICSKIKV